MIDIFKIKVALTTQFVKDARDEFDAFKIAKIIEHPELGKRIETREENVEVITRSVYYLIIYFNATYVEFCINDWSGAVFSKELISKYQTEDVGDHFSSLIIRENIDDFKLFLQYIDGWMSK